LKNDPPLLPLSTSYRNVAIIGDDGFAHPLATGDGSGRVNCPYIITPLDAIKKRLPNSKVVYARTQPITNAMKAAKEADIAIVFVSVTSSEGRDRQNLSLPFPQDDLISQVRSVQKNVVVVLHIAGAVTMPWVNDIPSIVSAFLPGQEDGIFLYHSYDMFLLYLNNLIMFICPQVL
jgi:beta-glucosidase